MKAASPKSRKIKSTKWKWRVLIAALLIIASGFTLKYFGKKAEAGEADSTNGWLWGGSEETGDGDINGDETGVGWISTNSIDCDTDGNGFWDITCGGDNTTTEVLNYGINIPKVSCGRNCKVMGYAWSENIGWIDFNPQDHCEIDYSAASCNDPGGGTGGVFRFGKNLKGWARIVSIAKASAINNAGGWQGWISFSSDTSGGGVNYGVTINRDNTLSGYAWSDELGWIDFKYTKITYESLQICKDSCDSRQPAPVGGILSMKRGDRQKVVACYGDRSKVSLCRGGTNVTNDTIWKSNESSDVIELKDDYDDNCRTIYAEECGKEQVFASYSEENKTFLVDVQPVCGDGVKECGEECDEGENNGACPAKCSESCTLNKCRESNWREVSF